MVLPSSSSSSSDGRGLAAMGGDPATVEPGTAKPSEAPCCYYYSHLTTCNCNLLQLLSKYYIAIAIISVMICFYCYLFGLSTFTFTVTIQLVENPGMFSYC